MELQISKKRYSIELKISKGIALNAERFDHME